MLCTLRFHPFHEAQLARYHMQGCLRNQAKGLEVWADADVSYTEKAPNAWHRRGTQKTGNAYNQPQCPATGTTHRQSTRHYLKGSPGVNTHNINQHSSRARLHHSDPPPSLRKPGS